MSALDHPSLLTRLIIAGEVSLQMRVAGDDLQLLTLAETVTAEHAKPAEAERAITDEVALFSQALLGAHMRLRRHERGSARPFLQVIGVLLPEVRRALEIAFDQRQRPSP